MLKLVDSEVTVVNPAQEREVVKVAPESGPFIVQETFNVVPAAQLLFDAGLEIVILLTPI